MGKKLSEDVPLDIKAEMALKVAVAEAIAEHKRRGNPIVVWRNGKVVKVAPEDIDAFWLLQQATISFDGTYRAVGGLIGNTSVALGQFLLTLGSVLSGLSGNLKTLRRQVNERRFHHFHL